jgi:hypothetical protein
MPPPGPTVVSLPYVAASCVDASDPACIQVNVQVNVQMSVRMNVRMSAPVNVQMTFDVPKGGVQVPTKCDVMTFNP